MSVESWDTNIHRRCFKVLFTLYFVSLSDFPTQKATGEQVKRSVTLSEMTTSLSCWKHFVHNSTKYNKGLIVFRLLHAEV